MADSSFGKTSAVRSIRAAFTQVFPFRTPVGVTRAT
jgi:hypothetical protein